MNEFEKEKERRIEFRSLINNLSKYIGELHLQTNKTPAGNNKDNMDFSRYLFVKGYMNHFYIEDFDNVVIDLENFIIRFEEIGSNLNMIAEHYLFDCIIEEE